MYDEYAANKGTKGYGRGWKHRMVSAYKTRRSCFLWICNSYHTYNFPSNEKMKWFVMCPVWIYTCYEMYLWTWCLRCVLNAHLTNYPTINTSLSEQTTQQGMMHGYGLLGAILRSHMNMNVNGRHVQCRCVWSVPPTSGILLIGSLNWKCIPIQYTIHSSTD